MSEEVLHRDAEPIKVKVSKGMKGEYGWEISVKGDTTGDIISLIQEADDKLRNTYRKIEPENKEE